MKPQPPIPRDAGGSGSDTQADGLYSVFGLRLQSRLPLALPREAAVPQRAPDVSIEYGTVPSALDDIATRATGRDAVPQRLLVAVDGVARYLVEHGRRIVIDRHPAASDDDLLAGLVGMAMTPLLMQRHDLLLHGSAIEVDGRGIVFIGLSGSGKSTLAAACQQRGCRVMADDLSVIRTGDDAAPQLIPGVSRIKLLPEALAQLNVPPPQIEPVAGQVVKMALTRRGMLGGRPVPLAKIYRLQRADVAELAIAELSGAEKMAVVMRQVFPARFPMTPALRAYQFRQFADLMRRIPVALVSRPKASWTLPDLVERILANARNSP